MSLTAFCHNSRMFESRRLRAAIFVFVFGLYSVAGWAQNAVPRLMQFSGTAQGAKAGKVTLVFAIYAQQSDRVALWQEAQAVEVDEAGQYKVLLGANSAEGLPEDLFRQAEGRWLGVTAEGAAEQPRVLLASVPYALKAADAETLGGLPASAYLQAKNASSGAGTSTTSSATAKNSAKSETVKPQTAGIANTVPLWVNATTLGNSALTQSGSDINVTGALSARSSSNLQYSAAVYGNQFAGSGQVYGVSGNAASSTNGASAVSGWESSGSGRVYGVNGETGSATDSAAGIFGYEAASTGVVYGVRGIATSGTDNAAGVNGYASSTTGIVEGVSGSTNSTTYNASGVSGWEGATTGEVWGVSGATMAGGRQDSTYGWQGSAGVNGWEGNATTAGVAGVRGSALSTGTGASGVYGWEYATTGVVYGLSGQSDSGTAGAAGVYGFASAKTGATAGVTGQSASAAGIGVLGQVTLAGGTAGRFVNQAGSGLILDGLAGAAGTRVFSVDASGNLKLKGKITFADSSTLGSGMPACSKGQSLLWSGTAWGCSTATLTLGAGLTGSVASNLLTLSPDLTVLQKRVSGKCATGKVISAINQDGTVVCVAVKTAIAGTLVAEQGAATLPEGLKLYNGKVTTDEKGLATVRLPEGAEAANGDFRYQLTVIGQFAQAIVRDEIQGNVFTIQTDKPGVKVSWQVTGVRKAVTAEADRAVE